MSISKHILIIGGYGKAGTQVAKLLVKHSCHAITLAGRNTQRAKKTAKDLNREFTSNQAYGIGLNLSNTSYLKKVLPLYDVLIVCSPFPENLDETIKAIVSAGITYIDIIPGKDKKQLFEEHQSVLRSKEITCLLEAGWEPGLPALLARLAHQKLNRKTQDVEIHAVYRDRSMPPGSIADIMTHAKLEQNVFKDNEWKQVSMNNTTTMSLPQPFGKITGFPTELAELRQLPYELNLNSLQLFQGGHNIVSDTILFLWMALGLRRSPLLFNAGVKLFRWANKKFTTPESAGVIKVMASNEEKTASITASNMDLYLATAIPVVASILLIDEEAIPAGVGFMGHQLPVNETVSLVKEMGIPISINLNVHETG